MVRAICVPSSVSFDGSASPFSTGGPEVKLLASFRLWEAPEVITMTINRVQ